MRTLLTADGAFAQAYLKQFSGEIASNRELSEEKFIEKLKNADVVIHNAATIYSDDAALLLERNFDYTRLVIQLLEKHNPSARLIFLSSMSILDNTNDQAYQDPITMSSYAYSKYLAETYVLRSKISAHCVRFSTLFYSDRHKDGLSRLIYDAALNKTVTIYNGGKAKRNFIPIQIAAAYVEKLTHLPEKTNTVVNLVAPYATSFSQVVSILSEAVPNLKVNDVTTLEPTSNVLADFTVRDIKEIGEIHFSLSDEVRRYLKQATA